MSAEEITSGTWDASRLFLVGCRGTGKSTVARLLARRLGWEWIDADALLEARCGRSIRQIFAEKGATAFRDQETELLGELCRAEQQVIATGGGVVLRPANRARLKAAGPVVWLTADATTLWQRIQADAGTAERRPNLTVGGLAEVEELLRVREPLYSECASLSISTVGRSPEQVADAILKEMLLYETL